MLRVQLWVAALRLPDPSPQCGHSLLPCFRQLVLDPWCFRQQYLLAFHNQKTLTIYDTWFGLHSFLFDALNRRAKMRFGRKPARNNSLIVMDITKTCNYLITVTRVDRHDRRMTCRQGGIERLVLVSVLRLRRALPNGDETAIPQH